MTPLANARIDVRVYEEGLPGLGKGVGIFILWILLFVVVGSAVVLSAAAFAGIYREHVLSTGNWCCCCVSRRRQNSNEDQEMA